MLPDQSLNCDESLYTHLGEHSNLFCNVRNQIFSASLGPNPSLLTDTVRAIFIFQCCFCPILGKFKDWAPTPKDTQIVRDACLGLYPADTLESDFSTYGGKYGIAALAQAFRKGHGTSINRQWEAIENKAVVKWLVGSVSCHFESQGNSCIESPPYISSSPPRLMYLGKHPGRRKRKVEPDVSSPQFVLWSGPPSPGQNKAERIQVKSAVKPPQNQPPTQPSKNGNSGIMAVQKLPSIEQIAIDVDLNCLDAHSKSLAMMLCSLGESDIPKTLLLRAAQPKWFINQAGEPDVEPPPDINPLFANEQGLNSAFRMLESLKLVQTYNELESVKVLPRLRSLYAVGTNDMKYVVSRLVFHSFPEDLDAGPVDHFVRLCNSQLPHVEHVLKYFEEPDFIDQFSPSALTRVVYSGLLASGFGSVEGKLRILTALERIICDRAADPLLLPKLRFRRSVLSCLYRHNFSSPLGLDSSLATMVTGPGSTAFSAEQILLQVQVMIYQDKLSQAWIMLQEMLELDSSRFDESRVLQKKACFQVRICLFAGEFDHAKRLLGNVTSKFRSISPLNFTNHVSVYCETGDVETALEVVPKCDLLSESWQELGIEGRRASLAAAGTYLMSSLWMLKRGMEYSDARDSLLMAKVIYEAVDQAYTASPGVGLAFTIRRFAVSVGLAMIVHLEWRSGTIVNGEMALAYWQAALNAGKASSLYLAGPSFPEMIIKNTMCDIAYQLGSHDSAATYMMEARSLYRTTGRQFQNFALGSIWFDLVQQWNENNGMGRVSELDYDAYMERQRKSGFPWARESIRLAE